MAAGKILFVGIVLAGVAALALSKSANASSGSSGTPPPTPAPGATTDLAPAGIAPGIPATKRTTWHIPADASGQQAGNMVLVQSQSNPNDWVLGFTADAGGAGVLAYGSTPMSGLMAQAVAAGF